MLTKTTKTIDTRAYFDCLSANWLAKYSARGSMRSRIELFLNAITSKVPVGAAILDFGCGTGNVSAACSSAGYRVSGVDQSVGMIDVARQLDAGGQVRFEIVSSIEPLQIPLPSGSFDAIIASSVFEYLGDLPQALGEVCRVSRTGGWLFFTVPNINHPLRIFEKVVGPIMGEALTLFGKRGDWRQYLGCSIQRHPLAVWRNLLLAAGWSLESAQDHRRPLWLIVARKR
jgi:SAM-dependent methyltransferase